MPLSYGDLKFVSVPGFYSLFESRDRLDLFYNVIKDIPDIDCLVMYFMLWYDMAYFMVWYGMF